MAAIKTSLGQHEQAIEVDAFADAGVVVVEVGEDQLHQVGLVEPAGTLEEGFGFGLALGCRSSQTVDMGGQRRG